MKNKKKRNIESKKYEYFCRKITLKIIIRSTIKIEAHTNIEEIHKWKTIRVHVDTNFWSDKQRVRRTTPH